MCQLNWTSLDKVTAKKGMELGNGYRLQIETVDDDCISATITLDGKPLVRIGGAEAYTANRIRLQLPYREKVWMLFGEMNGMNVSQSFTSETEARLALGRQVDTCQECGWTQTLKVEQVEVD